MCIACLCIRLPLTFGRGFKTFLSCWIFECLAYKRGHRSIRIGFHLNSLLAVCQVCFLVDFDIGAGARRCTDIDLSFSISFIGDNQILLFHRFCFEVVSFLRQDVDCKAICRKLSSH